MNNRAINGDSAPLVIVGGGLVGSALALALARNGIACTMVSGANHSDALSDTRPLALAESSRQVLMMLGCWADVARQAEPIRHIIVSERGAFSKVRLHASDVGREAFGHVTEARHVVGALDAALAQTPDVHCMYGARLVDSGVDKGSRWCDVTIDEQTSRLHAPLVIGADGGGSALRVIAGVKTSTVAFDHVALTARVMPRKSHQGIAYERFTGEGPLALLPMRGGYCGLVWCMDPAKAERRMAMSDSDFAAELGSEFGPWLGGFRGVQARRHFELQATHAQRLTAERLALIGNAADQLHPVAGQGLNLALRDVARVIKSLRAAKVSNEDPGAVSVLESFASGALGDHIRVGRSTDFLARGFAMPLVPIVALRRSAMGALALLPALRRRLAEAAMGLESLPPLESLRPLESLPAVEAGPE